jgi:transporter family-2 protein
MAIFWIALAFSAGLILAAQAGFNVMLANGSGGPIWGAFLSNLAGIAALGLLIAALRLPLPRWQALASMPPSAWLGGVCGVAYVIGIVVISPRIGLAATVALAVAGQTISAILLDHFGLLGFAVHPVSIPRIVGGALLVAGVALIRAF